MSWQFWKDFIPIEEAVEVSGADEVTLKRLLYKGILWGQKKLVSGRWRWLVERRSLVSYFNRENGFALDLPGPKLFLSRQDKGDIFSSQFSVTVHNYDWPSEEEEFTVQQDTVITGSVREAAQYVRELFGPQAKVLVVRVEKRPLKWIYEEWTIEI